MYLGFDNDTGRDVAWNVISFKHLNRDERKRIGEEIQRLKTLDSPYFIKFINAWQNKTEQQVVVITDR